MDRDEREMKEELGYRDQLSVILENTDPQPVLPHLSGWENTCPAFPEKLWNALTQPGLVKGVRTHGRV